MRLIRILIIGFLWLGAPRLGLAGSAGREPFNFLFLDANARAVGMGGAYTALAKDANALLYNPAGLGKVSANEATFMENRFVQGVSQEYIGFAARQGWGFNVNHLSFGDIPRTTISNPDGSGNFGIRDLAVGVGFGRSVNDALSLGVGVKYIREAIDDVTAQGYAADLGALFTHPNLPGLSLGLAVQNIGPAVRFQSAKENLPLNVRLGAAYRLWFLERPSTVSLDVTKARSEGVLIGAGAEAFVTRSMALRLGFSSRNDAGPGVAVGLGWVYAPFRLDYALVPLGELGEAHRISVAVRWGGDPDPDVPRLLLADREKFSEGLSDAHRPEERVFLPIDVRFQNAERSIAKRSLGQAKLELQEAGVTLSSNPKDRRWVYYHERLGYIFFIEGDLNLAKASFTHAIKLARQIGIGGEHVADAYMGLGLCLIKESKPAYAAKFLQKALEIGPSSKTRKLIIEKLSELESHQ